MKNRLEALLDKVEFRIFYDAAQRGIVIEIRREDNYIENLISDGEIFYTFYLDELIDSAIDKMLLELVGHTYKPRRTQAERLQGLPPKGSGWDTQSYPDAPEKPV